KVAPPAIEGLMSLRGVLESDDAVLDPDAQAALEAKMAAAIGVGLDGLLAARRQAGASLIGVLGGQVDRIDQLTGQAHTIAADQPAAIKARFQARMTELIGQAASEERIVQEAAAMAVKADVREELDRLAGHVAAARELLATDGAVGRRLDFLTQEFMREANTLCSKSALSALTAVGLDL